MGYYDVNNILHIWLKYVYCKEKSIFPAQALSRWFAKVRNKIYHFLFKTNEADILSMQKTKHGGWNQEGLGV